MFLAGGKYSFKREPLSTACLLLSILPRYPSRTVDHQYHLQALRHFYVLAVESRILHTVDVDTGLPISVDLQLDLMNGVRMVTKAPGLLPQLNSVKSISIVSNYSNNSSKGTLIHESDSNSASFYPCRIDLSSRTSLHNKMAMKCSPQRKPATDSKAKEDTLLMESQRISLPTFYIKKVPKKIRKASSTNDSLSSFVRNEKDIDILQILKSIESSSSSDKDICSLFSYFISKNTHLKTVLEHSFDN
jgi:hypothetical protein